MKFSKNEKICIWLLSVAIIISALLLWYEIFENRNLNKNIDNKEHFAQISYYNEKTEELTAVEETNDEKVYVINTETKKIHSAHCEYAKKLSKDKKATVHTNSIEKLLKDGYTVCGSCNAKDKK